MLFVCLTAMFLTNSRGGVLASLLIMVFTFGTFFRQELSSKKRLFVTAVSACGVVLLLLFVMGGKFSNRLGLQGLADEGRLSTYRSTIEIIRDNPWFGTGLGTFRWSFPAYRRDDISAEGIWEAAHSTPLEFASEVGLPMTAIVSVAWLAGILVLVRGLRKQGSTAAASLSALAVSLIALLHTAIDFSMQVAGYSILVFALLGVGIGGALLPGRAPLGEAAAVGNRRMHAKKSDIGQRKLNHASDYDAAAV
jgi:O-antigen ligase